MLRKSVSNIRKRGGEVITYNGHVTCYKQNLIIDLVAKSCDKFGRVEFVNPAEYVQGLVLYIRLEDASYVSKKRNEGAERKTSFN